MFGNAAANDFIQATGLTGATQKAAITQLCVDLQASGLWDKMKAVYPMITDQRNLYQYTEDFTNAVWQKSGISATGDTTTAPNGTSTADTLQNGTTSGYVRQVNLILSAGQYTQSCYFKKNNNNWVAIYTSDGGANYAIAYFNVNTGVVGTTSAIGTFSAASSSIQDAGNGWYRCSLTFTKPSTGATEVSTIVPDADNSFSRTVGQNTFAWGAQLESGNQLSTYQPILTTPAAFMASQMKYNLKDARDLDAAFRLTWSGGWTYSATGATPNGTNAYADTKLLPNANLSQNSTHLSSYIRNTSQGVLLGSDNAFRLWIAPNFNGINKYVEINSGATTAPGAFSSATGLWVGNRIINTQSRLYNNNSLNYTATSTSAGLDTINIFLSARNTGVASNYSSSQVAFASIGDGLSEQETLLLNQITEKYQVALSRGVQAAQSFYYNSAYSNEANTYLYSTQITGTTQVSAINTLINGLKANNLWTKMKAVYPFVTDKINLLGYTEDFANAYWGKISLTATLSGSYNNSNFFKLADSVNGSNSFLFYVTSLTTSSTVYTASANFKKGEYDYAQIHPSGSNGAVFNLANGTIVSNAVTNATITDIGSGWYRCSITYTASGPNVHFSPNKTSTSFFNYSGTIGSGIFMQSPQVEVGTNLTTYQPVLAANNYATNVAAQMKFNLVNPQDTDAAFRLAFSGGWTYSTNGAQPNGTNGYADTKLVPSTQFTAGNNSSGVYIRTENTNSGALIGTQSGGNASTRNWLFVRYDGTNYHEIRNNTSSTTSTTSPATSQGFWINNRPTTSLQKLFRNGLSIASGSIAEASFSTVPFFISCQNSNGTAAEYSNRQLAFAHIGEGLSDAEALALYTLTQQFQTDLSRNV